jgi:eukaryotic-like serine/threonine-protein kinase
MLSKRYSLQTKLGEGGMGVVWLAHDSQLNREVAIKLLKPEIASAPEQRKRFEREAQALASLTHENIVRVYDYGESGDDAFLVMEFVNGENLGKAVLSSLPVGWEQARSYAIPVCQALAYAHEQDMVHRDLTPANILLDSSEGRVVVTDFGLARVARGGPTITSAGVLIGTPEFWSPEQATGTDTDASTDMYALGCILFLLLSGRLPFEGEDRLAVGLRRAHQDAPSLAAVEPALPEIATSTVDQLLQRDRAARPTARALLERLVPGSAAAARTVELEQPVEERADEEPSDGLPAGEEPAPPRATIPIPARTVEEPAPRRSRLVAILAVIAALVAVGTAIAVIKERHGSGTPASAGSTRFMRMPRLVGLPLSSARTRLGARAVTLLNGQPRTAVTRIYSESAASGVVLRQQPAPYARVDSPHQLVSLVVSRGSAFAPVPSIAAGSDPDAAASTLSAAGFDSWRRFTPSWSVRKGNLVSLTPKAGARVHRPARVTILVSSGYPKSTVPALRGTTLSDAEGAVADQHLHYTVAYAPSQSIPAGQVMSQSPAPGSVMVQGHTVQITVARTPQWKRLISQYGTDTYQSPPFTVGQHWRIVYHCGITDPSSLVTVLTDFSWSSTDPLGPQDSFSANTAGPELHTYYPSSGAGTFQLQVEPYEAGTTWYFEVDALQ